MAPGSSLDAMLVSLLLLLPLYGYCSCPSCEDGVLDASESLLQHTSQRLKKLVGAPEFEQT